MKYFVLQYIQSNDGESGACRSYDIARSINKDFIDKIIKDNNLNVKTTLERGESQVFLLTEYEPTYPEYFNKDQLELAFKDLEEDKIARDEYERFWGWR